MGKTVSVIIPIYQVEKYVRLCIDSVLKQTYCDLEVILVDDGSTDDCPHILDAYAEKDSRVRVIHKKNGGLSEARNTGIEAASGEYISFVDGDDYCAETMIEKLVFVWKQQTQQLVSAILPIWQKIIAS